MNHAHPLKAYREANKLSVAALGELLGISKASVSRIENGLQEPSMPLLRRIIERTSLTANDFLQKPEAAE